MLKNPVRTRFAPSPTGELHVGGARTVLFNYLLAKQNSGQFILRVEDTDLARNQEIFVKNQYQDLIWLGLKPDESIFQNSSFGPYQQSQRLDIYKKYTDKLLQEKKAYYCFCSPVELSKEREEYIQENQRRNYQYSRKCLSLTEQEVKLFLQNKQEYLIRFQINRKKSYDFTDLVRNKVVFQGYDTEDFVIFRSNGMPTYHLAVVIDDYLMKISHVLRGEEHLSNTAKQLILYEALDWEPPQFGHLSLILNKEKKKLSKRDPDTGQFQFIHQLRDLGYLPVAINNYLLFLGWHPREGITQEFFSLTEAIKTFKLTGLHAKGAVYDLEKLNWYNNYYIQKLSEEDFFEYACQFLGKKYNLPAEKKEWVKQVALLFRSQLNYFQELLDLTSYFFEWNTDSFDKPLEEKTLPRPFLPELNEAWKILEEVDNWEEKELENCFRKMDKKKSFPLLRERLTGKKKGPELIKIVYLLGKKVVLERLKNNSI